jgi:serine/threonine-protein kinase HipA
MNQCLYCYKKFVDGSDGFHPACSKKMFGNATAPKILFTDEHLLDLANKVIKSRVSVTGVQPKLSLEIEIIAKAKQRFTIVGLWGDYILKPPTQQYPSLPELEDVTMHLAELCGINTVPHSLIRLMNGELAYITKRIDRVEGRKIPMEDMCQLTEKLTEQKYNGSYEQIGNAIIKYSANPFLDIINFFEQVIFSFLTGNADMHLKNFSLIQKPNNEYILSPSYDMVSSALVVKGDDEDLALTLNGKKKKIRMNDFDIVFELFTINQKTRKSLINKFNKAFHEWMKRIDMCFLPRSMKRDYKILIQERMSRLGLSV